MTTQNKNRDLLTGLWNHKYAFELLKNSVAENDEVALILINVDRFKAFNDCYGLGKGNDELIKLARQIEASSGSDAVVSRRGGDEFSVFLPGYSLEKALQMAEKIRTFRKAMKVQQLLTDREFSTLTFSLGVAHFPTHVDNAESLFHLADFCLDKATFGERPDYAGRDRVTTMGDFLEFSKEATRFLREYSAPVTLHGFAVAHNRLSSAKVEQLRALVGAVEGTGISKRESVFAIRNLLDVPEIRELAQSLRYLVEPFLGKDCFAVRGIFFDKTPDANWKVPYHQDLSIAVKEKAETAGFGPWSEKAGVVHVQPPAEVLEKMLTVRLHLDDCDENNGALRVIPGSHQLGKLDSSALAPIVEEGEVTIPVPQGGAMLMRPLLLHASSPATNASHRRVIHLEFAGTELPGEMEWLYRV